MTPAILTLNAGSSSVKFAIFTKADDPKFMLKGAVTGIGSDARVKIKSGDGVILEEVDLPEAQARNPGEALDEILAAVAKHAPNAAIMAVGHRIVHGGLDHVGPVKLDTKVLDKLTTLIPFAPLHQPHNLAGIKATQEAFPDAPQIGCFDTAFHRSHPWVNDTFALPRALYEQGVRRFGFHGLSYEYISHKLDEIAPYYQDGNVIVAHLGNGSSMCAIRDGHSVGSTMGFSALDGLPMGTRCGQLDPGVVLFLMDQMKMSASEIEHMLYRESGLKGLSGISGDMRVLLESDAPEAAQALDYFVTRIRREIGAMTAILGGLDAVVFTGGIGENADLIRERICDDMDWIGIELDEDRNRKGVEIISSDRSRVRVFVLATNEELVIARHVMAVAG